MEYEEIAYEVGDDGVAVLPRAKAAEIANRAMDAGAYVAAAHPAWYSLTERDLEALGPVDAIEAYKAALGFDFVDFDDKTILLAHPTLYDETSFAASLHEIGRAVSFSGFHKHGAYLIENSELAGFSRADQRLLHQVFRRV